ncbi:hypothetical protein V6N13_083705 [Hibiscus sabdariffa]
MGTNLLVSSFLWEPISSLQLSKGANSISPAFYGRKFWSLAFHGNQSLGSSFLWEPISSLPPSTRENFKVLAFYGNQSPVSCLLREKILRF